MNKEAEEYLRNTEFLKSKPFSDLKKNEVIKMMGDFAELNFQHRLNQITTNDIRSDALEFCKEYKLVSEERFELAAQNYLFGAKSVLNKLKNNE